MFINVTCVYGGGRVKGMDSELYYWNLNMLTLDGV